MTDTKNHNHSSKADTNANQKSENNQFKVIIAIKCVKELNHLRVPLVRCSIQIQEKQKITSLPFSEGQFFDLKEIDITRPIQLTFSMEKTNKEIGNVVVKVPGDVLSSEEVELADDFSFEYGENEGTFRGSYYIIILNKLNFIREDDNRKKVDEKEKEKEREKEKEKEESSKPVSKHQKSPNQAPQKKPIVKSKEEEQRLLSSAKRLQDKVDIAVKNAIKEIQTSKDIVDQDLSSSKELKVLGTSIAEIESPTRLSTQVQLTRSGTKDLSQFTERVTAFNYDESPQKQGGATPSNRQSNSPTRLTHSSHNAHNHTNMISLYYIDQATQSDQLKTQTDYYKKVIYLLQTKMDTMKETQKNNDRLVDELLRAEQKHKVQDKVLQDTQAKSKQAAIQFNQIIDGMAGDIVDLQQRLRQKSEDLCDAEAKIQNLEFDAQLAQQQLKQTEMQLESANAITRHVKQQDQRLDEQDKRNNESFHNYDTKLGDLSKMLDVLEKQKLALQQDLNKAQQVINAQKGDISLLSGKNKELVHQIQAFERQIQVHKAYEGNIRSLNAQLQLLQKDIVEMNRKKNVSDRENQNLKLENENIKGAQLEYEIQSNDKQAGLRQKIIELDNKLVQVVNDLENLTKVNIGLRQDTKLQQLNDSLVDDLFKQVEEHKSRAELMLQLSKDGQVREKDLQSNIQVSSQNLHEARLQVQLIQQQLVDTQIYGQSLKKLILEMKETGVAYIAFHNDPIDKALADFIMSMNDPTRIMNMFVRESEGVYLFGTRKVYLKVEQDRILIRTGGGFMGIEEFLDVFVHVEADKMRDSDPKKDYDRNQLINKTIDQAKVIKKIKSQTSPLKHRSPQQSQN